MDRETKKKYNHSKTSNSSTKKGKWGSTRVNISIISFIFQISPLYKFQLLATFITSNMFLFPNGNVNFLCCNTALKLLSSLHEKGTPSLSYGNRNPSKSTKPID